MTGFSPTQDTLSKGGFGNLVSLPSQKQARERGNTAFLNEQFQPHPDPWAFLKTALAHGPGVLAATSAFGKTVLATWLITQRGVNTLILVYRQQLLIHWIERLSTVLGVSAKPIGRLGGGRRKLTGALDVGLMHRLVRKGAVDDRVGDRRHLVVDECHHVSARSVGLAARRAKERFVTDL